MSREYFRVARVPLVRGRAFDASAAAPAGEVVINETRVRRLWTGRDALGGRRRLYDSRITGWCANVLTQTTTETEGVRRVIASPATLRAVAARAGASGGEQHQECAEACYGTRRRRQVTMPRGWPWVVTPAGIAIVALWNTQGKDVGEAARKAISLAMARELDGAVVR